MMGWGGGWLGVELIFWFDFVCWVLIVCDVVLVVGGILVVLVVGYVCGIGCYEVIDDDVMIGDGGCCGCGFCLCELCVGD